MIAIIPFVQLIYCVFVIVPISCNVGSCSINSHISSLFYVHNCNLILYIIAHNNMNITVNLSFIYPKSIY